MVYMYATHDLMSELTIVTLQVLQCFERMAWSDHQKQFKGLRVTDETNISNFVVIIAPADVLAPNGAKLSAGTVMTKFEAHVYGTSTSRVYMLFLS